MVFLVAGNGSFYLNRTNLSMKTAIVCDWLVTMGGAEKCLAELLTCFPDAHLFAVIDFIDASHRHLLQNKSAQTTFIQALPFAKKYYRSYLPLMPLAIEQLNLSDYNLIISSSHAVAKGVITGSNQIHISYIHTPMRYAWDLQHQYLQETGLNKTWRGLLARYFLHRLRMWDLRTANGVDHFIANSQFIAKRIKKIYRRHAKVIYPPVDTAQFVPHAEKANFYVTASRLVPYKRVDLIVESFATMPDKELVIIGDGPDMAKIKSKASRNIKILGYQPTDVLIYHLQRAKALIFAAEEDFGLIPVEAQACGTPVIAFKKGGALETVRDLDHAQPTGVFFTEQTTTAIQQAVQAFLAHQSLFSCQNCVENASRFTTQQFRNHFKQFVHEKIQAFQQK
jgi:glycosyltransferase involved in cell wall biosynthesis